MTQQALGEQTARRPRILLTAGPTHEPIDAVRFIGNRSSGRLGIALAEAAASRGWETGLLLGPTCQQPSDSRVHLERFRTAEDLRGLLRTRLPGADVLVMAAAVADYRARSGALDPGTKLRRGEATLVLELEPTPDLLAEAARGARPDQLLIGFALEPGGRLLASASEKLRRKKLDLIVANPLETMDASGIDAWILASAWIGRGEEPIRVGPMSKAEFADRLLDEIARALERIPNKATC